VNRVSQGFQLIVSDVPDSVGGSEENLANRGVFHVIETEEHEGLWIILVEHRLAVIRNETGFIVDVGETLVLPEAEKITGVRKFHH
jgi:hypothetical protein